MRSVRTVIIAVSVCLLAVAATHAFAAQAREAEERLAHSNGQGTLRVGDEKFKITAVIVKLLENGKAEITLISDITLFLSAEWSNKPEAPHQFDLEILGGATAGGLDGKGQVVLSDDNKSVRKLTVKSVSRTTRKSVEAEFAGK